MNHATLGHFVCDENGRARGGKPGDQTGKEGRYQAWYAKGTNGKGWENVFRAKKSATRKKIAKNMCELVENPNVGYNQDDRTSLDTEAKKVGYNFKKIKTPCNTDCSQATAECIIGAGIPISPDMYTGDEKKLIEATGEFKTYTGKNYVGSDQKLKIGDILHKIGHSAVVTNVQYVLSRLLKCEEDKPYMCGEDVVKVQERLNKYRKKKIEVSGEYDPETVDAVIRFQKKKSLEPDGIVGRRTAEAMGFWWED